MTFEQSRTYGNLQNAFNGEMIASTLYELFSDKARDEGYIEIANIFDITSRNEKEHARIWQRRLNNGILPGTEQNLLRSSELEVAAADIYRDYAQIAREEGFADIAALFNGVANIELNHDLRFRSLYDDVVREQVFCKPGETLWICMACGNILSGICAPEICPVCLFPQGYYRVYDAAVD
ncbi:MAG: rubrerythrin family protein [Mobilitalea sp.]